MRKIRQLKARVIEDVGKRLVKVSVENDPANRTLAGKTIVFIKDKKYLRLRDDLFELTA